ncbi:MAG TPA: sulfite exporter TauE/SafE family protein [Syntrophomonadaceae bacterium]|nr:sulfite exporter TauE/SafE family protein [Syntrophomonadaceae bacterium]
MGNESFFKKYQFTIILLAIMVAITIWAFSAGKANMTGAPQLSANMILLLTIVGFAAGCLGGWIGTGGCSVMLPILHFWMGFPAPLAVGTTLFAVIFTAISGGYGHLKQRNLDTRAVLYLGGFGVIGVFVGSWLFTLLSDQSKLLGFILGLVFLWPAIRMIREGIKKGMPGAVMEGKSIEAPATGLGLFGTLVGTLTGLVGLGGGYALVPGLIYLFGAPVYITMGTSLATMIPMAIVGGLIKLSQGFVVLGAALVLASGTIVGAQIGAATIKKFKPSTLKLIFGIYFLYVAIKFIGNYLGIPVW